MARLYKNNIETTSGFTFTAEKPLDDRQVQGTINDLSSLVNNHSAYDKMVVGIPSKGIYHYSKSNNRWIRLANIKNITRNGSTIEVLDEVLDDNSVNTVNLVNESVTSSKIGPNAVIKGKVAANAINSENIENPISIAKGGTGASTVADALIALNGVPIEKYMGSEINRENIGVICMWDNGGDAYDSSIGPDDLGVVLTVEYLAGGRVFLFGGSNSGQQIFITHGGDIYTRDYDTINYPPFEKMLIATNDIADSAITTSKLADLVVTTIKLANGSVNSDKLGNLSVITSKLADLAVTTIKLANSSVTTEKLNNGAVTADKIGSNAVTNAKILNGAVTEDKLDQTFNSILLKGTYGTELMLEGDPLSTGMIYIQYDV